MTHKTLKKIASVFVAAVTACSVTFSSASAASTLPKPTDKATEENVLTLLERYNRGFYDLFVSQIDAEPAWITFFESQSEYIPNDIVNNIGTAVHETSHVYSGSTYSLTSQNIYLKGKTYPVSLEGLFTTSEAFTDTPDRLKTSRYNTYIVNQNSYSNVGGVLGLLDEFVSYHNGLEVMVTIEDWLTDSNIPEAWGAYAVSTGNDICAYVEFKYYVLTYMLYAKANYPDVYKSILNNKAFCTVYSITETDFSEMVEHVFQVPNITINGDHITSASTSATSYGTTLKDYYTLKEELSNSKYVSMDAEIKAHADTDASTTSSTVTTDNATAIGDINGDGKVNALDAAGLLMKIVNGDTDDLANDCNNDGKVNALDVVTILLKIVGKTDISNSSSSDNDASIETPAESTPAESTPAESTPAETPAEDNASKDSTVENTSDRFSNHTHQPERVLVTWNDGSKSYANVCKICNLVLSK